MIAQCDSTRHVERATVTQKILGCIAKAPGITQVGVAKALNISLAEVHLIVRKLVVTGKLERIKA